MYNPIPNRFVHEEGFYESLVTDSTGQSALKSSELLENGLLSFEK